eukprot:scaffold8098_cov165-Ochromonas_danica.AAC.1
MLLHEKLGFGGCADYTDPFHLTPKELYSKAAELIRKNSSETMSKAINGDGDIASVKDISNRRFEYIVREPGSNNNTAVQLKKMFQPIVSSIRSRMREVALQIFIIIARDYYLLDAEGYLELSPTDIQNGPREALNDQTRANKQSLQTPQYVLDCSNYVLSANDVNAMLSKTVWKDKLRSATHLVANFRQANDHCSGNGRSRKRKRSKQVPSEEERRRSFSDTDDNEQ